MTFSHDELGHKLYCQKLIPANPRRKNQQPIVFKTCNLKAGKLSILASLVSKQCKTGEYSSGLCAMDGKLYAGFHGRDLATRRSEEVVVVRLLTRRSQYLEGTNVKPKEG